MSIPINVTDLKMALLIAPKKDVRPYRTTVCIDVRPDHRVFMVATDGHVLGIRLIGHAEDVPPGVYMLPRDRVEHAIAGERGTLDLTLTDRTYTLGSVSGPLGAGRYADYLNAVPRELSGEMGQFDPDLLARAKKFLGGKPVLLQHNGPSGGALMVHDNALCVVMPMHTAGIEATPHDFVF